MVGENPVEPLQKARVPRQIPAEAGNRSRCAQPRAERIAGLWTAPLPARSSPASQHSGDGGLPGKKIALDLELPDLAGGSSITFCASSAAGALLPRANSSI